jgi:hypothetical protein
MFNTPTHKYLVVRVNFGYLFLHFVGLSQHSINAFLEKGVPELHKLAVVRFEVGIG